MNRRQEKRWNVFAQCKQLFKDAAERMKIEGFSLQGFYILVDAALYLQQRTVYTQLRRLGRPSMTDDDAFAAFILDWTEQNKRVTRCTE